MVLFGISFDLCRHNKEVDVSELFLQLTPVQDWSSHRKVTLFLIKLLILSCKIGKFADLLVGLLKGVHVKISSSVHISVHRSGQKVIF